MTHARLAVLPALLLTLIGCLAQSFQNLDFELSMVTNVNAAWPGVPITNALPYWSGVIGDTPSSVAVVGGSLLDGGHIGLHYRSALFGDYSAYLQDDFADWIGSGKSLNAELAQTGVIPPETKSLRFYTRPFSSMRFFNPRLTPEDFVFSVLVNGQVVRISPIEETADWVQWGADVSGYAGTLSELRFALNTPYGTNNPPPAHDVGTIVTLDNIAFSSEPFVALIGEPPRSQSTFKGATVSFNVTTIVPGPFAYEWQFEGATLAGATNSSLVLTHVTFSQSGKYSVVVSNSIGIARSPDATLSVGAIAAWGDDYYGQTTVPAGLTNVLAIAAGDRHSAALLPDRTVTVWGDNTFDQRNVPSWVSNVAAIAGSAPRTLALMSGGTVGSWGMGGIVKGLSNAVAVSGNGSGSGLALRPDGTVVSWGDPAAGFKYVSGTWDMVAIAPGMALSAYGTVKALGDTNVPAGLTNVIAIAGAGHRLALKSDGTVVAWGNNTYGQAEVPPGLSNVIAIAAGFFHSVALKADGTVAAWGAGKGNASSEFERGQRLVPEGLTNVVAISANGYHSLALVADAPPPLHVRLGEPARTTNGVSVPAPSQSGRVYRMDYRESLDGGGWVPLPLVAGSGGVIPLVDPGATNVHRFYRVNQW